MADTVSTTLNMTARELLEEIGGYEHALHTVMSKAKMHKGRITFTCSCDETFSAQATSKNIAALRNVTEKGEA